ncbi:HpcH/HpaI aldolase/citrate lyase family protein, partial [Pseudomonas aeruginosa]|nr:HpcH/HpaI aldolase/citrate lyase family protein [Pseudomonas aeruginosa]
NDVAPAVFKHNDAMCEPATHYKWAVNILERAKWHGVKTADMGNGEHSVRLAEAY